MTASTLLLDTSVLIDTINGKRRRPQILAQLVQGGHKLACCSINITEVYAGMRPHEQERTEMLLTTLVFTPITRETAALAGTLLADYRRKGITLGLPDATIAAVAMANGYALLTDNAKDYPMPGLSLFDWPPEASL